MDDKDFSNYLLGRLSAIEAGLAQTLPTPPPVPPPAREPTQADKDAHFLANLDTIAGLKPSSATATPAAPPATLSRGSATYARDFAKYAEAIATGKTTVVE